MSQLQLGLLAIGVGVILAVVLYNQWNSRKNAPRRSLPKSEPITEPLEHVGSSDAPVSERVEPVFGTVGSDDAAGLNGAAVSKPGQLDPLIDAMATLALEHLVSGDAVLAALPSTRRVGTKLFAVEGLNANTQVWESPAAGQRYSALQAGVQLANRLGPLNEIEFSEFVMKVQHFADAVQAAPDFPDMMQEVARARELDQFASAHDAQLGFTIRARRASWSPGYLGQHAAAQGFVAGVLPGRLVLPAGQPGGAPVLVLQYETQAALADDPEQSALREFQLSLDVPHVPRSEEPYQRMCQVATALAQTMEGSVTDGSNQALSEEFMQGISVDLAKLYDALAQRELDAGSPLARRLFS
jgi:ZipA, C-terminal FtsZ-binding domain